MQKQPQISSANMPKSVILFLVLFSFVDEVLNLACYTSNFSNFMAGNVQNLTDKLQDCSDFINATSNTTNQVIGKLSCFTIIADYLDIVLKGCIPEGNCSSMKNVFEQMIETNGVATADSIGNVNCRECNKDKCNEDNIFLLPNFNFTGDSSFPPRLSTPSTTVTIKSIVENKQNRGAEKLKRAYIYLLLYSVHLFR